MASTFSPSLRIELIGDGDQSGTWGQTTNNNLGTLIEQAISGVVTITMADANYTLTNFNGVSDEARNQVIVATGTNTNVRDIIAPLVEKTYIIKNSTTGGYAIRIIGSSGTGVSIPNGVTASVYCDGINFYSTLSGTVGNFTVNGNLAATGTANITGALSGSTATFSGAISSVSPAFTGVPTVPTAAPGTNTTQAASTAFVTGAISTATGSLGTMSTQNANNVNITGGTISGLGTPLPVASGGSGRSTLTANNVVLGNGTSAVNFVAPGSAGNLLVSNGTTWTSNTLASSGVKLGLGITGEVWNNVTGSRSFNTSYPNSRAYPIAVSASTTCSTGARITAFVNGAQVAYYGWQFNGCGAYGGTFIIVPPGATYQLNAGEGVQNWVELY
jgi:hypothetical protein